MIVPLLLRTALQLTVATLTLSPQRRLHCGATGHGVCYYVDATAGNDASPGTSARPFRTLQHAADLVNPGDGVVVKDGVYTGRALRALHAEEKARCLRELDYDLEASPAYSDSHTDLPFLEAVGHPVAVNPDRALRRIAAERRWPVLEFGRRAA